MSEVSTTPPKRFRWGLLVLVLVIIALVALVVMHILGKKKQTKPHNSGQVVNVAGAKLGDMPETLDALGTVTPYATEIGRASCRERV